jgi:large subunit ribosomal protein L1
MPNPKMGTVTMNIAEAIQNAKLGEIPFKCDKNGVVYVAVGKVSFTAQMLEDNAQTFLV